MGFKIWRLFGGDFSKILIKCAKNYNVCVVLVWGGLCGTRGVWFGWFGWLRKFKQILKFWL